MSSERRRDVRAKLSPPAAIIRGREAHRVQVIDASYRGMLLRTETPPEVMSLVRLRIDLPSRVLETHAIAMRLVGPRSDGRWDVGVRFFALNGEDQREWESYVAYALARLMPRAA